MRSGRCGIGRSLPHRGLRCGHDTYLMMSAVAAVAMLSVAVAEATASTSERATLRSRLVSRVGNSLHLARHALGVSRRCRQSTMPPASPPTSALPNTEIAPAYAQEHPTHDTSGPATEHPASLTHEQIVAVWPTQNSKPRRTTRWQLIHHIDLARCWGRPSERLTSPRTPGNDDLAAVTRRSARASCRSSLATSLSARPYATGASRGRLAGYRASSSGIPSVSRR